MPFYLFVLGIQYAKKTSPSISKSTFLWAITMGLVGYYLSSLFDFIGLQYVTAGIERIILFIYPTLAVLINFMVFKVPILKKQVWAILITYLGIGIAYWGEIQHIQQNNHFLFGSLMVCLCGITYAVYLVGTGKLIPKMGSSNYTSIAMLSASAGIFMHFLITENYQNIPHYLNPNNSLFYFIVGLALIATVIPSFLLSMGMQRIGSNNLAIITSVGPVATLFQANLILGESFNIYQGLGTLLVILGVVMVKKLG